MEGRRDEMKKICKFTALVSAAAMLVMAAGCGDGEKNSSTTVVEYDKVYTEYLQPIENALAAIKSHDGELITRSYFPAELVTYEAEVWSEMTVEEYYETFDNYLESLDSYYSEQYGDDYTIEFEEVGIKIKLDDDEFEDLEELYSSEANGEVTFDFTDGYDLSGQLTISGSLGEATSEVDVAVLYSEKDGWLCYLSDFFVSAFYESKSTESK